MRPIVLLSSQLRIAAKCLIAQHRHPIMYIRHRDREHHWQPDRSFSSTPTRLAAEDPENIVAQLQRSPIMRKIADKPEALKALQELAAVIKETNIDFVPGKQPSMIEMMRLASNSKFRDGVRNVVEELKKAGVEINKDNAFELFGVKRP